jgi:hypothetical protein
MAQALNEDRSCQKIVDEVAIKQALNGRQTCITNTGAYCKARQRMPLILPSTLTRYTGQLLSANSPHQWHWKNRPIRLVDGMTSSLPDTAANQAAYPPTWQSKARAGFSLVSYGEYHLPWQWCTAGYGFRPLQGKGQR